MKKILSILVMVLCGVICIQAVEVSHTIIARAVLGGSCDPSTKGGTVAVQGCKVEKKLLFVTYYETSLTSRTEYGKEISASAVEWYDSGVVDQTAKAKYKLYATAADQHYFNGWYYDCTGQQLFDKKANTDEKTLDKSNGTARQIPYYAIFKHYVYGYGNGRSAEVSEGADYGEISLDNTNWSNVVSETVSGDAITKKQKGDANGGEEEYITLTYYAQYKEGYSEENSYFLGWYDAQGNLLSTDYNFNYKFYPTSEDVNSPTKIPTIFARFGKKALYKDYATAQVVLQDNDGNYQEVSPENQAMLSLVGGVYVNSNKDVVPKEGDFLPSNSFGTKTIKYITTNDNSGNYEYTYHAVAKDEYIFLGWADKLPNNGEKITIKNSATPYTYQHFTESVDEATPDIPETLYAVFAQNTYYYYTGAVAGFTTNGEKGRITVTSQYYNTATEGEEIKTYTVTSESGIDDSESIYNTALNTRTYSYTYKAEKTDDKTTFKGWSRSLLGGNIISDETTYTEQYVTTETRPEDAYVTPALYAVFQSFWFKDPTVSLTSSSAGAGRVAAMYSNTQPDDEDWKDNILPNAIPNQVPADQENYPYSVYYYAEPKFGADFVGWANADDPEQLITDHTQNPYKVDYVVTSTDDKAPFIPAKLYAVFESVIKVIQQDRMIYYVDEQGKENINDANILINFNASNTLDATLKGENAHLFVLSDKSNVEQNISLTLDASTGLAHLVVKYTGENPANDVGKSVTITLSSDYSENGVSGTASIDLTITIEHKPTITFLPADGKGAYTIKHTDGRGIEYNMPIDATENIYVPLHQENMAMFELSLTEDKVDDGLTFSGWEMIDKDGNISYFAYDKLSTCQFKQSVSVRPAFSSDNLAVFTIIGDQYNKPYVDLQEALDDAKKRYDEDPNKNLQVVVFSNEGKKNGVLQQGDYVIKEGVMLLIPGVGPSDDITMTDSEEDTYVYRTIHEGKFSPSIDETAQIVLDVEDYISDASVIDSLLSDKKTKISKKARAYRKLIVEDNTTITIQSGANLELYSILNRYNQSYDARPYRYGHMELGENCLINVQDGGTLYAFGYVTGAHSSQVIAQPGATVHEVFQYSDPRGGSGVAHLFLCRDYYKVFPFSQFYVQNIEIPLELKSGSVEYITTTADVLASFVVMTSFVIPDSYSSETSGLFRLGNNTSLVKYYDPLTDRLTIKAKGDGGNGDFIFGFIDIIMGDLSGIVASEAGLDGYGDALKFFMSELGNVELDSRDYVLPLNNNMDISVENTNVSVNGDFAFLAGSTLKLDETSNFIINSGSNVYIYDAAQNKLPGVDENMYGNGYGYYGNENTTLDPIVSTPNNSQLLANGTAKRQSSNVKDSKWVVNGQITVKSGGGFYTTAGGAQITSTNNGKVTFEKSIENKDTYQSKYKGGGASALVDLGGILSGNVIRKEGIHNRMTYPVTSAKLLNADGNFQLTSQNTFTYDLAQGKWITSGVPGKLENSEIVVTLPDYNLETPEVDPLTINVSSTLQGIERATFSVEGAAPTEITGIIKDAEGVHIPVSYTPSNIAGEYEGVLALNINQYYQKVIFREDYTPKFSLDDSYTFANYLGYEQEVLANILVETDNVASIIDEECGYAPEWNVKITGPNADEFTFEFGEGANKLKDAKVIFKPKTEGAKNALLSLTCTYTDAADRKHTTTVVASLNAISPNILQNTLAFADGIDNIFLTSNEQDLFKNINSNMEITISPASSDVVNVYQETIGEQNVWKIAPLRTGTITITATQEPDFENGISAATITQTIHVTDDVVWNWNRLYFGSENINPITTKYAEWTLAIAEDGVDYDNDDVIDYGDPHRVISNFDGYSVSLANWEEGETYLWFAFNYMDGEEEKTKYFKSEVYRDPRILPISVNDDRIYEAVTDAFDKIVYDGGSVAFNSDNNQTSSWTFGFKGIPDLLSFTVDGTNNWQIEESFNGTNWSIAYTWAPIAEGIPFELALQPATQYVRISYATGANEEGVLSNISVSELKTVRADVDKLYMPLIDGGVTKNVVFTYVSENGYDLSTSHNFFTTDLDNNKLPGLNTDPFYVVKRVGVNSAATEEVLGSLDVKNTETKIPIQTFTYPQAIPVQLASDHLERFYYVTSEAYKTTWNADTRAVVMQNAVADAAPYVVFHFADAPVPGIISFNFPTTAHGTWEVKESSDASVWTDLKVNTTQNLGNGFVMQDFQYPNESRYVRITYVSDYAEVVELTNLSILPTTSVTVNPFELEVYDDTNEKISVTANNLKQVSLEISEGFQIVNNQGTPTDFTSSLVGDGTKALDIYIDYLGREEDPAVTYGELNITTTQDANGNDIDKKVLATVKLTGIKRNLPIGATGIKTGVPNEYTIKGFDKEENYEEAKYRDVVTTNAFADDKALFDYVIIYGETTTSDDSKTITTPTSTAGSNAKTPCYIYQKKGNNYELFTIVENANSSSKSWRGALTTSDGSLKVYITGFCPYASTGYSKADEGVWYFQGSAGESIDVYLEDCYIYSRYKSKRGNSFSRSNGETFSDKVVRGSGAVLLFANTTSSNATALNVTIHTRGRNLLKSHYGCLYESIVGRAFQISAPVHVYMQSVDHYKNSYTELNFTDEWPIAGGGTERTNGFLSLQKQVNNAPSVDMGNKNTVVNFRGGQVELQNALNSSDNYESTLAISYRTGIYGPEKFKFTLAHGIGTDGVEGRVNFYDGTTTVMTMTVPERYRQYYLMDGENEEQSTTSCLRSQKYTFVYGGSHCMMRACSEPTSKGGAPTDGDINEGIVTGNPLGLYQYPQSTGWESNGTYGLVTPTNFPGTLQKNGNSLSDLHATYPEGEYGVSSIYPNAGNYLNLWVPGGYGVGKQPEVDQKISYWKACMTHIEASYGVYGGEIGGMTTIDTDADGVQTELVYNLLYCEIDENIRGVITGTSGVQYSGVVLNPAPTEKEDEKYIEIPHSNISVSDELKNYITNDADYKVQTRVYYIVPAVADVWMNFTAPFDVENVYIMETFDEALLMDTPQKEDQDGVELSKRESILLEQAKHNADFAGFFGVALALESKKPFWDIYQDYMGWAKYTDKKEGRWKGYSPYTLRGAYKLRHYYQETIQDPETGEDVLTSNWNTSDYVLYKNNGPWEKDSEYNDGEGRYIAKWDFVVPQEGKPLMKQGQTYSMQFPYCTGCWDESYSRDFWDYWTGKFLIFESTDGGSEGHTIKGASFVGSTFIGQDGKPFAYDDTQSFLQEYDSYELGEQALLLGNQTFAKMGSTRDNLWTYYAYSNDEGFWPSFGDDISEIEPTGSFLIADVVVPELAEGVKSISRGGNITYKYGNNGDPNNGTTTGTHTPTVGGGNDMFITAIDGGINIAVAAPQTVCVVNATGHVLYNGYVTNNVNVHLSVNGIYVVKGENEVQKIFF